MLTFQGSLDMQGSQLEAPASVAVAFEGDLGNALHIVEATTEGSFPEGFRASLGELPPRAVLQALGDGEPELAYGYLTAVEATHPDTVRIANSRTGQGGCEGGVCTEQQSWCSEGERPADDVCYTETRTCDLDHQNCTVEATGDVALKTGPWQTLAGLSVNYLVLYLRSAAPAGSLTSLVFAEGGALAAGYHLLAASERTPAEHEAARDCFERADQAALDGYNRAHGTQYEEPSELPPDADGELSELTLAAQRELRCAQTDRRYVPVVEPSAQPIRIRLSRTEDAFAL